MKSLFFMRLTFFCERKQAAQPCEFFLITGRLYHAALPRARRFLCAAKRSNFPFFLAQFHIQRYNNVLYMFACPFPAPYAPCHP